MAEKLVLLIYLYVLIENGCCYPMCQGEYGLICCNGYRWEKTIGRCLKCETGFTGLDCSLKCWYPRYGDNCKKQCSCDKKSCDFANGCIYNTEEREMSTSSRKIPSSAVNNIDDHTSGPRVFSSMSGLKSEAYFTTTKTKTYDGPNEKISILNLIISIILSTIFVSICIILIRVLKQKVRLGCINRQHDIVRRSSNEEVNMKDQLPRRESNSRGSTKYSNDDDLQNQNNLPKCNSNSSVYEEINNRSFAANETLVEININSDYLTPVEVNQKI